MAFVHGMGKAPDGDYAMAVKENHPVSVGKSRTTLPPIATALARLWQKRNRLPLR
jgi:hypothetical protein